MHMSPEKRGLVLLHLIDQHENKKILVLRIY
jgi:hypothetical protein